MLARLDVTVGVSLCDISDGVVLFDIMDGGLYCAMRDVWYSTSSLGIFGLAECIFLLFCFNQYPG